MRRLAFLWVGAVLTMLAGVSAWAAADVLQQARARGSLVVATAPAPEQLPQAARISDGRYTGYDVEVANEIGRRLGLPVRFVSPGWDKVLAGTWGGEWDLAVSSITPTTEREQRLSFPAVYRFDAAALVVRKDDTAIERPADASRKKIGVRTGTTFENYLRRNLVIYGNPNVVTYLINEPQIRGYPERAEVVDALVKGQVDAIVTSLGLAEDDINRGAPLRIVPGFLYFEPVAVAVDKGDPAFAQKVGDIVRSMRADGTLTQLSEKWFGVDVAGIVP